MVNYFFFLPFHIFEIPLKRVPQIVLVRLMKYFFLAIKKPIINSVSLVFNLLNTEPF